MGQQYVIFGVVAMFLITFLTVFSTQWAIRKTGYEFFKAAHWISAILYIGACWGHWDKLWCWMVPSLALIVVDQSVRFARMVYIHRHGHRHSNGFQSAQAEMKILSDDNGTVIRLDFDLEHLTPWEAGQHFYLTFPSLSLWQSHPFTVASTPDVNSRMQHHTYLLRVRDGQTKKLAEMGDVAVSTILTGPYGKGFPSYECQHILAIAGGTGVTFTLPIVFEAIRQFINKRAVLDFVWVVRKSEDLLWLSKELAHLKRLLDEAKGLRISIYVSRESTSSSSSSSLQKEKEKVREKEVGSSDDSSLSSDVDVLEDLLAARDSRFSVKFLKDHHPSVSEMLVDFQERVANVGGLAEVVGSGPEAMGSDLRAALAKAKNGHELRFYWDSRE
jgi:NAD(P)H-flavin reductase